MLVRLLPNANGEQPSQIVMFWETIKFACQKADMVHVENYQAYFNELLHDLLSDKAQCFVKLDDKRAIIGVLITSIIGNKLTGEKSLCLQSVYSFRSAQLQEQEWQAYFKTILEIATNTGCKTITLDTNNREIAEIVESVGCKEVTRSYEYRVGA